MKLKTFATLFNMFISEKPEDVHSFDYSYHQNGKDWNMAPTVYIAAQAMAEVAPLEQWSLNDANKISARTTLYRHTVTVDGIQYFVTTGEPVALPAVALASVPACQLIAEEA